MKSESDSSFELPIYYSTNKSKLSENIITDLELIFFLKAIISQILFISFQNI